MFDGDQLRSLPDQLQPFRGLADPLTVRRAVLTQMRYVADVASSLPSKAYSTSGGLFRLVWRQCRGRALTLRLRTVFLFVPQPVAACLKIPVAARRRPELASILLSEQLPSACSYLAAKCHLDLAHTPSETFARWYMTRLTCGPLLLEACRQGCVPANILEHLQISQFRLLVQIRLPVLGAPGKRPLPRLPADTMLADLHRLGWRTDLVFQMPRERAQPLGAEIPLALRQLRDIAPPGASPLAEDADVVLSLRFYFLTARIPLATAQVQHLSSPERLVFGSAPLPRVAKRPRHAAPFSLADLIARLRQLGRAPRPDAGPFAPPPASSGEQPGMRTQRPRIYKQPGTGTQGPCRFCVGCFWFGWCLVSVKQPGSGPKHPKRQWPPPPFYLALWAILSVFLVPWSAGVLTFHVANACAACKP